MVVRTSGVAWSRCFSYFPASKILYENDRVVGVLTGDMGLQKMALQRFISTGYGNQRQSSTVFAEGCRGHLGKELTQNLILAKEKTLNTMA